MKYNARHIKRLLDEVERETGLKLARGNCPDIHTVLNKKYEKRFGKKLPFYGEHYLYRYFLLPLKDGLAKRVSLKPINVEAVAQALGYAGYAQFEAMRHPDIHDALLACEGVWYSYARCNSGQPYVLRAPVHIYIENRVVWMKLQGSKRTFNGKLRLDGDCIYCLLESGDVKNIYLVLKTGLASGPGVIQGVFSGLSTGGDPIAGREVLVRQEKAFSELSHKRISLREMERSERREDNVIAHYFSKKEKNILKAGRSSTFELDDLEEMS